MRERMISAPAHPRATLWRGLMLAGLIAGLPLLALWATGGLDTVARWAAEGQREAQNALAGALRRLRGGDPGAFLALMGLAFSYGVFHAAGPGHGKLLIGGYGVARRVRLVPLATLALLSSLAQATTAVVLVYAGVFLLNWTRERVVGLAENLMLPASHAAVALIGLWLAWRGLRGLRRETDAKQRHARHDGHGHDHGHDHDHDHGHGHGHGHDHAHHQGARHPTQDTTCVSCGHRHGPTLDEVSRVTSLREGTALIAGIAMRPCTGALFLLVLTWQMGIGAAGIAGAYAMGLGTALITVAVATLAVWSREGALATLASGRLARALPVLELAAGAAIALVSLGLLRASL
ncbi:MAG: nickel/cobalt transporter [Gemmobacter sp.]